MSAAALLPAFPIAPTPIEWAPHVSRALGCDVYVKREDRTHPLCGGNKARKLTMLLADARAQGATDLVTVGAAGSNHILATAFHGRALGFEVTAAVVPRPTSPEADAALRATVAQGCQLLPTSSEWAAVPRLWHTLRRLRRQGRRPYFIPPGGTSPVGALGYVHAVEELVAQHARGELPEWPDVMVCALGSGGLFAGLLAGVRTAGRPCRVVGVEIWSRWAANRTALAWLARRTLALALGPRAPSLQARELEVDPGQLGSGYGHPTEAAREAQALFAQDGVSLDLTYTAKTAAGLMALARSTPRPRRLLFWHSLATPPCPVPFDPSPPPAPEVLELLR
jgi:D-cysteine desulfhydrase